MAFQVTFALAVFALSISSASAAVNVFGGSTVFVPLANHVIEDGNLGVTYYPLPSELAITQFNAATLLVAVSNFFETTLDENTGVSLKPGKLTLPVVLDILGFIVGSVAPDGTVKFTAKDTLNIYIKGGAARSWALYRGAAQAGLKGTITVYGRSTGAGQNYLNRFFWKQGAGTSTSPFDTTQYPGLNGYYPSATAISTAVSRKAGSIGYAQVKIAKILALRGISEAALQNKYGTFLTGSGSIAVADQAWPRTYPAAKGNWSPVTAQLIFTKGQFTPPIVAADILYVRKSGLLALPNGRLAAKVVWYFVNIADQHPEFGHDPVPAAVKAQNIAAVKAAGYNIPPT